MCEIFPVVTECCLCIPLRIGLLFISVLAIITGAITLCIVEQSTDTSFETLKNITEITDPYKAYSSLYQLVQAAIICMSVCFMAVGVILLLATLTGSEGFVQVFVWVTFLNIMIGFMSILVITFECLAKEKECMMSHMDWLSGAAVLVILTLYLFLWMYFVIVGNSYVLNGD